MEEITFPLSPHSGGVAVRLHVVNGWPLGSAADLVKHPHIWGRSSEYAVVLIG